MCHYQNHDESVCSSFDVSDDRQLSTFVGIAVIAALGFAGVARCWLVAAWWCAARAASW
ncbi:hypothetical protein [Mycobacterium marinum]|uniref:hypothetical protein n=1 Tax=Mycobacterium marinum TaxID=1781 RepID=UPI0023587DCF|nr:hypothetical protein [Mycobacterium marinum]MDC9006468.1 hypothetical protein [Mycobacterium marinum]